MINKKNLAQTKEMFEQWWACSNTSRPLINIRAKLDEPSSPVLPVPASSSPEQRCLDIEVIMPAFRNFANSYAYIGEAVPNLNINIGPGSLAVYVGSEPVFNWDTVWYTECIADITSYPALEFDPENKWWKRHFEVIKEAKRLSNDDFYVCIPDIVENIDIISAMRGPQNTCFDLIDEPEHIKRLVESVGNIYFEYFDRFYEEVKIGKSMMYTAFNILGEGKTAKVQCDFSALIGVEQFKEFAVPPLTAQCMKLDHSMFHLDGKECIKHLDALMSIESLQGLQWTPGAGQPDCAAECWYPIYDKAKDAGKAMHVIIGDGSYEDWVKAADKFVKRYGCRGVYFLFPEMTLEQGQKLLAKAENEWQAK
ncbi:MAG: trimethylamine corrinoid protein 2 [Oscillospiraceae bacterium]|nr:trimethylamine corrinoid protein 2 [Oscillospiraceae bacterium]